MAYHSAISISGGSSITMKLTNIQYCEEQLRNTLELGSWLNMHAASIRSEHSAVKFEVTSLRESAKVHSAQVRPKIPSALSVRVE